MNPPRFSEKTKNRPSVSFNVTFGSCFLPLVHVELMHVMETYPSLDSRVEKNWSSSWELIQESADSTEGKREESGKTWKGDVKREVTTVAS